MPDLRSENAVRLVHPHFTEYHCAKCQYAESHCAGVIMLSVIVLSVIMLRVIMLTVILQSVI